VRGSTQRGDGATAALTEMAKEQAGTSYRIELGENETSEGQYARATADEAGEEEYKSTSSPVFP
jgi:hypothetical protein